MRSTSRLLRGSAPRLVLAAVGLATVMWSAGSLAQTTTTPPATQPGTQPGVRSGAGTPQPATTSPGGRTTSGGQAQDESAREASVLRGPRADLEGLLVGGFVVHPRLAFDVEYDDNIFRTATNRVSDWVFRVRPGLTVDSDWDQHALQLYAQGELTRLASNSSESYEAFQVGARGRFDITEDISVNGEAEFARLRLPRGQPGSVGPGVNSIVHQITTGMSVSYNGDPLFVRVGPRYQRVVYVEGDGGINQDYNVYEIAGRIGYRFTPELSVFIDPSYQWVRYDRGTDPFGFQRNSSGFDVRAGVSYDIARTITAELGLGYFRRTFTDPRLAPISGLSGLARLYWNPTDTISIELEGRRGVTEYRTAFAGVVSNNAVNTGVQLRVGWLPLDQLLIDGGVAWNQYDYTGPLGRTDNYYTFDVGARYYIIPQVYVGPRYTHERRVSDNAGFDYRDNRFTLTLGGQL